MPFFLNVKIFCQFFDIVFIGAVKNVTFGTVK